MPDRSSAQSPSPNPQPREEAPRLFTAPFVLTCLAAVAFFLSHQAAQAAVPLYALHRGGSEADAGTLALLFSVASLVGRMPVAWAMDRGGRRPLMIAGSGIAVASGLLYPAVEAMPALFALRAFHGVAMGFFSTASAVVVTDITPLSRRGEGMGYFGMGSSLGLALGPVLALALVGRFSFTTVFVSSAAVAFIGVVLGAAVRETGAPAPVAFALAPETLFTRGAILPAILMGSLTVTHGALVTFLPLLGRERALGNPGAFFTVAAIVLVAIRAKAGSLSDRWGRGPIAVPGLLLAALAMGLVGSAEGVGALLVAGSLYGLAFGLAQPALMALAADRTSDADRGWAIATYYTGWELGIGGGAYALGHLLPWTGFTVGFWAAGLVLALGGIGCLLGPGLTRRRPHARIP